MSGGWGGTDFLIAGNSSTRDACTAMKRAVHQAAHARALAKGAAQATAALEGGRLPNCTMRHGAARRACLSVLSMQRQLARDHGVLWEHHRAANCFAPFTGARANLGFVRMANLSVLSIEACKEHCRLDVRCNGFTVLSPNTHRVARGRPLGCYLRSGINMSACIADRGRFETFVAVRVLTVE